MRYLTVEKHTDGLFHVCNSGFKYNGLNIGFTKHKTAVKLARKINSIVRQSELRIGAVRNPSPIIKKLLEGRNLPYSPK